MKTNIKNMTIMKKLYLAATVALLSFTSAGAQRVTTYGVEVTNGAYQEITDGTVIPVEYTGDEFQNLVIDGNGVSNYDEFTGKGFPIGFSFNYNGKEMNQFMVATNGYMLLGKDEVYASCTIQPFQIFSNSQDKNLFGIVPISKISDIPETRLSYKLEGEAPNRVLTVQYKDLVAYTWQGYYKEPLDTISMQYRLYENTGNFSMTCNGFEPWEGGNTELMSLKIGIKGEPGDAMLLTGFTSNATTDNDDNARIPWGHDTYPADGVTYTFIAPQPCVTPEKQPTELKLGVNTKELRGSFTPAEDADHHIVLVTKDEELTDIPADGTYYEAYKELGNAMVAAVTEGNKFMTDWQWYPFEANTDYNVFVMSYNAKCQGGPVYNTAQPLKGKITTMGDAPKGIESGEIDADKIKMSVTAADGYQVMVAYTDEASNFKNEGVYGKLTENYKAGDAIEGGGRVAYAGPSGSFEVENLEPGKLYYFKAWSTDGNGSYSFDGVETGVYAASYLPWSADMEAMANRYEPAGWASEGSFKKDRAGYLLNEITEENETGTVQWLETPYIYLADGETRVAADITMENSYEPYVFGEGDFLKIQVAADGEEYKDIAVYSKENDPGFKGINEFSSLEWTFSEYAGKKAKLRIYIQSTQKTAFYLSGIKAFQRPECDYPVNVSLESKEGKQAVIAWQQQGDETAWQVSGKLSSEEEWGEPVTVKERTYKMEGLESYASYDVRVRAVCSETSFSEWSRPLTFKSALYVPFEINLRNETAEPEGWACYDGVLAGPTVMESGDDFSRMENGLISFSTYDETSDSWYVSPQLDLGQDTGKEYEFTIKIQTGRRSTYYEPSTDNKIMLMAAADGENFYTKDIVRTVEHDEYEGENKGYTLSADVKNTSGKVRLGIYTTSSTGVAMPFYIESISLKEKQGTGIGGTEITDNAEEPVPDAIYNAAGQRTDRLQKGVNIVRYNNGKTAKILIK